jgi:hypothetical protein
MRAQRFQRDVTGKSAAARGGVGFQLAQMSIQMRILVLQIEQLVIVNPAADAAEISVSQRWLVVARGVARTSIDLLSIRLQRVTSSGVAWKNS